MRGGGVSRRTESRGLDMDMDMLGVRETLLSMVVVMSVDREEESGVIGNGIAQRPRCL